MLSSPIVHSILLCTPFPFNGLLTFPVQSLHVIPPFFPPHPLFRSFTKPCCGRLPLKFLLRKSLPSKPFFVLTFTLRNVSLYAPQSGQRVALSDSARNPFPPVSFFSPLRSNPVNPGGLVSALPLFRVPNVFSLLASRGPLTP